MKGPSEITFEVREADEGGYYAAAIGYDIITQGDSWDDLKLMAQDALLCHFDDGSAPSPLFVTTQCAEQSHLGGPTLLY